MKKVPRTLDEMTPHMQPWCTWMLENGAEILEPTNQYEVVRVKGEGKVHILYHNKSGVLTWTDFLRGAYHAFRKGKVFHGFVQGSTGRHYRSSIIRERLRRRDGDLCFYCGEYVAEDAGTVEHMLNIFHGGNNRIENLVLSCKPCNREAGSLSVMEKVLLREKKRAGESPQANQEGN